MSRAPRRRSTRRLAALLALAVVPALTAAPATGKGSVEVHPQLRVIAVEVSGSALRFTVAVSFKRPTGSAACKGKVKLVGKAKPHHKAPRWSARLAVDGALCEARIRGTLPAALLDHRVAFALSFPGNGKIGPFSTSRKLKMGSAKASKPGGGGVGGGGGAGGGGTGGGEAGSPGNGGPGTEAPAPEPPPILTAPYTAADGHWKGGGLWDTDSGGNVEFGVEKGVIHSVNLFSTVLLRCEKKDSAPAATLRYAIFGNAPEIPLQGPVGKFSGGFTDKRESASADQEIPWVLHGELGASSGTMAIEAHGASFDEHFPEAPEYTVSECHASITMEVGKQ